jgi:hypothetical protein
LNKLQITILIAALGSITSIASASQFPQCPTVGYNTGCAVLITINNSGTPTVEVDATQGPYDRSEDTLVGVLNNSSYSVDSLQLSSSTGIFGFDGDGMCSASFGAAGNCSQGLGQGDPYDYAGDLVTFTITDANDGRVNFVGGLAPGASAYFSLEENLTASDITAGPTTAPEPASYYLLSTGLAGCFWFAKRRKQYSRG